MTHPNHLCLFEWMGSLCLHREPCLQVICTSYLFNHKHKHTHDHKKTLQCSLYDGYLGDLEYICSAVFKRQSSEGKPQHFKFFYNCSILEEWLALGPTAYIWYIGDGYRASRRLLTLIRAMIKPEPTWLFLNPGVLLMQKAFESFLGNTFKITDEKTKAHTSQMTCPASLHCLMADSLPTLWASLSYHCISFSWAVTPGSSAGWLLWHWGNAPCLILWILLRCKMDVGFLPGLTYIGWTLQDFSRVAYYCFSSSLTFQCLFFWPLVSLSSC